MKLYSYVVEHDNGYGPNPYFRSCTLCRCKEGRKNIVELAKKGDWIAGTGGANRRKSAGHGKLVYAMRVDEKLTRGEYFADSRFAEKKPVKTSTYEHTRGDNERPRNDCERKQSALVSRHFYYFGANAIDIPGEFDLEKKGPGFRSHFDPEDIRRFVEWLEKECKYKPGKYGEPCYQEPVDKPRGSKRCK